MDTNDNGYLTISDLKTICESVNLNFSNKILREMVEEADNSGDGKISLEEFTSIMCQTARFKRSAPK
jgi:Ca2+-binding EF-hand superfamily protein